MEGERRFLRENIWLSEDGRLVSQFLGNGVKTAVEKDFFRHRVVCQFVVEDLLFYPVKDHRKEESLVEIDSAGGCRYAGGCGKKNSHKGSSDSNFFLSISQDGACVTGHPACKLSKREGHKI